jgi:hypothetical protein
MWNGKARHHLLRAANSIASLGLTTAGQATGILAAALTLLPVSAHPASVFIQVTENSDGTVCPGFMCAQIFGGGPATQAPVTFVDQAGSFISGFGEVTATTMKMSSSTNASGGVSLGLSDTFLVQGAGSGPVSITAVWHATGTFSSVPHRTIDVLLGAALIRIGTLGSTNTTSGTLYNIAAFGGPNASKVTSPSNVFSSAGPVSFNADMTATHTIVADIGSTFDMAFGLTSGFSFGATDFSHTATLSFLTPDGVYLTSGLGGTFGDVPVGETPIPAALPLFATGLAVLGLLARRRRKATAA